MNQTPLIEVKGLFVNFVSGHGILRRRIRRVRAVSDVNLAIYPHETLGVVGESGCGKTTLGRSILRLVKPTAGQVLFEGEDLVQLNSSELRKRRREMQIIFQSPQLSFDTRFNVLNIVAEPLQTHTSLRGQALTQRVVELLLQTGMPGEVLFRYPHEFSGGQLQRIAVARALALNPKFLVLDEPTSALDVSVQAQIINLFQRLQAELELTYLFITHDLSVIQHISDRVAVMYVGKVVELSTTNVIFDGGALHPYTKALLASAPTVDSAAHRERIILQGSVPNPANPPPGCTFHPRCPVSLPMCSQIEPKTVDIGDGHLVSCHLFRAEVAYPNTPSVLDS